MFDWTCKHSYDCDKLLKIGIFVLLNVHFACFQYSFLFVYGVVDDWCLKLKYFIIYLILVNVKVWNCTFLDWIFFTLKNGLRLILLKNVLRLKIKFAFMLLFYFKTTTCIYKHTKQIKKLYLLHLLHNSKQTNFQLDTAELFISLSVCAFSKLAFV